MDEAKENLIKEYSPGGDRDRWADTEATVDIEDRALRTVAVIKSLKLPENKDGKIRILSP